MQFSIDEVAENHLKYENQTVVIKFGGEIFDNKPALRDLLQQVRVLQIFEARVVLVHGGGVQITQLCDSRGIKSRFEAGERVCDKNVLDASIEALAGVNQSIRDFYGTLAGGKFSAVGLSGGEAGVLAAPQAPGIYTGQIEDVQPEMLAMILERPRRMAVVHPICSDGKGGSLNVNADHVAVRLALALQAKRLLMCTNVSSLQDKQGLPIFKTDTAQVEGLIADGTITGGMLPKVRSMSYGVEHGIEGAAIVSPANLAAELFTASGAGTLITRAPKAVTPSLG